MFLYWFFKFRRILKLSNDINSKSPLAFGSNSLLQCEWQMLSNFRKGKDTRYVKNHGFSVLCAKDKVAQLHSCSYCGGFYPRLEQCLVHLIPAGQFPTPLPKVRGTNVIPTSTEW